MSEIDAYQHRCIGIVACPSRFPIVAGRAHRDIPLYRLDEDALDGVSFRGKRGDILLGGGSGESAALRIAIPEAFFSLTHPDWAGFASTAEIVEAYWSMTDAYVFGEGYRRLGWTSATPIEQWLAEHILSYLAKAWPTDYLPLLGPAPLASDGSICRQPTNEEIHRWGG